jgi:hypothetical protein
MLRQLTLMQEHLPLMPLGAFRRFRSELHEEYPDLLPVWYVFRDTRAKRRAVEWLTEKSLIDDAAAASFLSSHPDPALP